MMFRWPSSDRLIGLRAGRMVVDDAPERLDEAMLTEIYGAEDWSATDQDDDDPDPDGEAQGTLRLVGTAT